MTQQIDPTFAPTAGYGPDPATHGWPTPSAPNAGYPPPDQPFVPQQQSTQQQSTQQYQQYPAQQYQQYPAQQAMPYAAPAPARSGWGIGRILAAITAATVVLCVLGGILFWLLLSPSQSSPATSSTSPATPSVSQNGGSPVPSPAPTDSSQTADSPAVAAAARQQLTAAVARYDQAVSAASAKSTAAKNAHDKEAMRASVADFRAATYQYDTDLRAITFPNEQQNVVNTQLLVATGALVEDLDTLGQLDPATAESAGEKAKADLQTSMQVTQQLLTSLGG